MSNNSQGLIIFEMLLSILLIIIVLQQITDPYVSDVCKVRFEVLAIDKA